jgi:hypothetical protein
MSVIGVHIRRFSDYEKKVVAKSGKSNFDKKSFFVNLRIADGNKVVILDLRGDRNDEDVKNQAEFIAMHPLAAAEMICRLETMIVEMGVDFDKYRDRYLDLKEEKSSQVNENKSQESQAA